MHAMLQPHDSLQAYVRDTAETNVQESSDASTVVDENEQALAEEQGLVSGPQHHEHLHQAENPQQLLHPKQLQQQQLQQQQHSHPSADAHYFNDQHRHPHEWQDSNELEQGSQHSLESMLRRLDVSQNALV